MIGGSTTIVSADPVVACVGTTSCLASHVAMQHLVCAACGTPPEAGSRLLSQVRQINGVEVNNLATLVEVAEACKEKYIKVELDYNQASTPCLLPST